MSDQFNWDIVVRLATEGISKSKGDVEAATKAVDELNNAGKISEKTYDQFAQAAVRAGKVVRSEAQSQLDLERKLADARARRANAENQLVRGASKAGDKNVSRLWDEEFKAIERVGTAREKQDRLYNDYLSSQEAGLKKQAGILQGEILTAENRAATATKSRVAQERAYNQEVKKRDVQAWDKEFQAISQGTSALKEREDSVISLRYANYDLATSMFAVSGAIAAAGIGVTAAFAVQESAFTSVERTADGALGNIRDTLTELSTQIPFTFQELSKIATLGNQLGIDPSQLEAFTKTVAEFSTVTGISVEESALAFGKLGNLLGVLPDEYDRLASSIALVGRTTAATEQQIVSVASEIAPAAAAAGFTADQVVGLSGALASLKVPPERSRSTILQFFETLNMAVSQGGDKLESFARVVGVTAGELESMVRSGQGSDILTRFVGNASAADTIEITRALEELGLAGLRTNPTIRALAGNMKLLQGSLSDGSQGWSENTELQRQMAFVLDDLATKWQTFLNAAMNAAAAVGASVGPAVGQLLDVLKNLLIGFTEFANSDFGQSVLRIAGAIGTLIAAYAALRGGIALATGTVQAFVLISSALGGAGIRSGLAGLASAFGTVRGAAAGAAGATAAAGTSMTFASRAAVLLGNSLKFLGRATLIIGVLQVATSLIFDFVGSMQWLADTSIAAANVVGSAVAQMVHFLADAYSLIGNLPGLNFLGDMSGELRKFANVASQIKVGDVMGKDFRDWAYSIPSADKDLGNLAGTFNGMDWGGWTDGADGFADALGGGGGGSPGVGKAAKQAQQEVRTLKDYASDLDSVFSRAFEIRFSAGSTMDQITSSFIAIREASEAAALNIRKLKADIQGLQSDINIQKYFLGIAMEYGDTKRAEAIQANLAKLQADLADKTASLSQEQSKNSKELTGNSKAAIENRAKLADLVQQYQAHITALAASGMGQAELAQRTAQLKQEFIQQATQMGYNRTEVDKYAKSFDDMRLVIERIPRNINIAASADPAIQALREFAAQAKTYGLSAGKNFASGFNSAPAIAPRYNLSGGNKMARQQELLLQMMTYAVRAAGAAGRMDLASMVKYSTQATLLRARIQSGNYWSGGFTGRGGKYEPAGVVHRGEYVVPKEQVNQRTGLPYADAMGKLSAGASGPGYANGGYVRNSGAGLGTGQIAAFGPMAQQQMAQLFQQYMRVYIDGKDVSDNSAGHYAQQTTVGAY